MRLRSEAPFGTVLAIALALVSRGSAADVLETDICVFGGSSGGVVGAAQAARMGKQLVLLEPGQHLGGMTAGGTSIKQNFNNGS